MVLFYLHYNEDLVVRQRRVHRSFTVAEPSYPGGLQDRLLDRTGLNWIGAVGSRDVRVGLLDRRRKHTRKLIHAYSRNKCIRRSRCLGVIFLKFLLSMKSTSFERLLHILTFT